MGKINWDYAPRTMPGIAPGLASIQDMLDGFYERRQKQELADQQDRFNRDQLAQQAAQAAATNARLTRDMELQDDRDRRWHDLQKQMRDDQIAAARAAKTSETLKNPEFTRALDRGDLSTANSLGGQYAKVELNHEDAAPPAPRSPVMEPVGPVLEGPQRQAVARAALNASTMGFLPDVLYQEPAPASVEPPPIDGSGGAPAEAAPQPDPNELPQEWLDFAAKQQAENPDGYGAEVPEGATRQAPGAVYDIIDPRDGSVISQYDSGNALRTRQAQLQQVLATYPELDEHGPATRAFNKLRAHYAQGGGDPEKAEKELSQFMNQALSIDKPQPSYAIAAGNAQRGMESEFRLSLAEARKMSRFDDLMEAKGSLDQAASQLRSNMGANEIAGVMEHVKAATGGGKNITDSEFARIGEGVFGKRDWLAYQAGKWTADSGEDIRVPPGTVARLRKAIEYMREKHIVPKLRSSADSAAVAIGSSPVQDLAVQGDRARRILLSSAGLLDGDDGKRRPAAPPAAPPAKTGASSTPAPAAKAPTSQPSAAAGGESSSSFLARLRAKRATPAH